jgi:hypothetical protein
MALLMYADDTAVLATSEAELQSLLDCIQDWCCEHGMTIHIHKTEIVVFNTTASALSRLGTRWSIAGAHVKVSQHFKYLGIHFHFSKGAAFGAHKALHSAVDLLWLVCIASSMIWMWAPTLL